jgi:hypothetical protein
MATAACGASEERIVSIRAMQLSDHQARANARGACEPLAVSWWTGARA